MYKKLIKILGKEELILPYLKALDGEILLSSEREILSKLDNHYFVGDLLVSEEMEATSSATVQSGKKLTTEFLDAYRSLFYEYTGNASMRDSLASVRSKLDWFKRNLPYDDDVILEATRYYLETEGSKENYKFCRKAGNFIVKGAKISGDGLLESYCEIIVGNQRNKNNVTIR